MAEKARSLGTLFVILENSRTANGANRLPSLTMYCQKFHCDSLNSHTLLSRVYLPVREWNSKNSPTYRSVSAFKL